MRTIGAFLIGTFAGHWLLAHVAVQVIAWHPLAVRLAVR